MTTRPFPPFQHIALNASFPSTEETAIFWGILRGRLGSHPGVCRSTHILGRRAEERLNPPPIRPILDQGERRP